MGFALGLSDVVFIILINVKMPTIVGILTFMNRMNFVLSCVEHGKSFITSRPLICSGSDLSPILQGIISRGFCFDTQL